MVNVKKLLLNNYRNHRNVSLEFGDSVNLIVGGNAEGKTNILESIYFIGRGKSFKQAHNRDVIKDGSPECTVKVDLEEKGISNSALLYLDQNRKLFKKNNKVVRGSAGLGVILFVPQDITIFRESPVSRRSYLDDFISTFDRVYKLLIKDYSKVVSHRNKLLKRGQEIGWDKVEEELLIWNRKLIGKGVSVIMKRRNWIDNINERLPHLYKFMGGVGTSPFVEYRPRLEISSFEKGGIEEAFEEKLSRREELEKIRGITMVGPHRDDWMVLIDGYEIKSSGSQGQMRMMALSLKVMELEFSRDLLGESPILMLDDVISELDSESSGKLLDFVDRMNGQVFITSTDETLIESDLGKKAKVFRLESGSCLKYA